jgi:hypothetical protein
MVYTTNYKLELDIKTGFTIIVSFDNLLCPICQNKLSPFGTRVRKFINSESKKVIIIIRRLRCTCSHCRKIHHELPDNLIPYKRYEATVVEKCIDAETANDNPACEISTIYRIKKWFREKWPLMLAFLQMRRTRYPLPGDSTISSLADVQHGEKWLTRLVWDLANHGFRFQPVRPVN